MVKVEGFEFLLVDKNCTPLQETMLENCRIYFHAQPGERFRVLVRIPEWDPYNQHPEMNKIIGIKLLLDGKYVGYSLSSELKDKPRDKMFSFFISSGKE